MFFDISWNRKYTHTINLLRALAGHMLLFKKLGELAPPDENTTNLAIDDIGQTFNNIGAAMTTKDPIISLCVFMYAQGGRLQAARAVGSTDHLIQVAAAITEATRLNFF